MEMKDFAEKVKKGIEQKIGEGYTVSLQEVSKNNGVILQGLLIMEQDKNITPTIYLDSFWEAYEKGIPFSTVIEKILKIYEEDTPKENIDMSFFQKFECVKERICFRLISAQRNEKLLEKIPHIAYLDMAICFFYAYQGKVLGAGSILIHNTHLKMWDITVEELYELAQINTPRLFPWDRFSLEQIVRDTLAEEGKTEECSDFSESVRMEVVSNETKVHGASCVLYPGLMQKLAEEVRKNLFVIPSSIHEIIILPDCGKENIERLREIIMEVNKTQVVPEEILSDQLYYFNRLSNCLEII